MDDIFTVLNAFPQTKMWVDDGWPVKHDMIVLTQFKPSAIGHCLVGFYMVSNSSVTWVAHPRYRPSHGFWGAFALHISRFAVTEARTCSAQQDSMVLAFSRHSWHCSPPQPLQMLSMQDDTHASRGDKWVWKPNMWNPKKPNCCNLNAEKTWGMKYPTFHTNTHTHTKGEQKLLPQFIQLQKWSFGPPGTADIAHPHSRGICFRCNRSRFRRSWAPTASSRGECGPWLMKTQAEGLPELPRWERKFCNKNLDFRGWSPRVSRGPLHEIHWTTFQMFSV